MSDLLFKELYKKSLRFLGIRLRSEKEMRDKIATWLKKDNWAYGTHDSVEEGNTSEVIDRVLDQLKKDRFVDDRRFAEEWVSSRMRSKPRGEVLLRMELAQKGIDRFMIEDVMEDLLKGRSFEDSEENTVRAMALKVGMKNVRKLHSEDDRAFKFKMSQILARKGFEGSTIKSVVDELLSTRYNGQD
jgi:regulatory protein